MFFVAGLSGLMFGWCLVSRCRKMLVAAPASASARDGKPVVRVSEIVEDFAGLIVIDDGSHRHGKLDGMPIATRPVTAFAMPSALGLMFGIKPEMEQRVVVVARDHDNIAAAASIAAARTASGHEFLAPERKTSVAAVAGLHLNFDFVNEQLERTAGSRLAAYADEFAHATAIAKLDNARYLGEERVVLTAADILAGFVAGASLTDQDGAAGHQLAAERLHAEPLCIRIATVFRTA